MGGSLVSYLQAYLQVTSVVKALNYGLHHIMVGRWIDSVWKSRSYADGLKENPINLYIFLKA